MVEMIVVVCMVAWLMYFSVSKDIKRKMKRK